MVAHRIGWIAACLATGVLLGMATQVKLLRWLPDFPVYDLLAGIAGVAAIVAVPLIVAPRSFIASLSTALFVVLATTHVVLVAMSSNSALLAWRDLVFWAALATGLIACFTASPAGKVWQRALVTLVAIFALGEAVISLVTAWYAPSFGESGNFATYQYVVFQSLGTALVATIAAVLERTMLRGELSRFAGIAMISLFAWAIVLLVGIVLVLPMGAGPLLLTFLLMRLVATLALLWPSTRSGGFQPLPIRRLEATATANCQGSNEGQGLP